jgi:hypothetical protein
MQLHLKFQQSLLDGLEANVLHGLAMLGGSRSIISYVLTKANRDTRAVKIRKLALASDLLPPVVLFGAAVKPTRL